MGTRLVRSGCALAFAVGVLLGTAPGALALPAPEPPPATASGALPPLPPLPPSPAPAPPPPPTPTPGPALSPTPETKVDVGWRPAGPAPPSTAPAVDDSPPRAHHEPERRWYGWQIILTDGAALVSLAAVSESSAWGDLALGLYVAGGPIVHLAHENGSQAAGSVGLRLLAPAGGMLIGFVLGALENPSCDCEGGLIGAGGGLVVGTVAASILDIALLAYDVPPALSGAHAAAPSLHLAPVAGLPRDSTGRVAPTFGFAGSF